MGRGKIYSCSDCSFKGSRGHYVSHRRIHKKTMNSKEISQKEEKAKFECVSCKFTFPFKSQFLKHMNRHRNYPCPICSFVSRHEDALREHMARHSGEEKLYCDYCDFVTCSEDALATHREQHKLQSYACAFCEYTTSIQSDIRTHVLLHPTQQLAHREKRYPCSRCKYVATSEEEIKEHLLMLCQVKNYPCFECDYKATSRHELALHTSRHTPHTCSQCAYTTTDKTELREHIHNHLGFGAFSNTVYSDIKSKEDSSCDNLTDSVESEPKGMNPCILCDYQGSDEEDLKQHLLIHREFSPPTVSNRLSEKLSPKKNIIESNNRELGVPLTKLYSCLNCSFYSSDDVQISEHYIKCVEGHTENRYSEDIEALITPHFIHRNSSPTLGSTSFAEKSFNFDSGYSNGSCENVKSKCDDQQNEVKGNCQENCQSDYFCIQCGFIADEEVKCRKHAWSCALKESNLMKRKNKCIFCPLEFVTVRELEKHCNRLHSEMFICCMCEMRTASMDSVEEHKCPTSSVRWVSCRCLYKYKGGGCIARTALLILNRLYCDMCNFVTTRKPLMIRHLQRHNNNVEGEVTIPAEDKRTFSLKESSNLHPENKVSNKYDNIGNIKRRKIASENEHEETVIDEVLNDNNLMDMNNENQNPYIEETLVNNSEGIEDNLSITKSNQENILMKNGIDKNYSLKDNLATKAVIIRSSSIKERISEDSSKHIRNKLSIVDTLIRENSNKNPLIKDSSPKVEGINEEGMRRIKEIIESLSIEEEKNHELIVDDIINKCFSKPDANSIKGELSMFERLKENLCLQKLTDKITKLLKVETQIMTANPVEKFKENNFSVQIIKNKGLKKIIVVQDIVNWNGDTPAKEYLNGDTPAKEYLNGDTPAKEYMNGDTPTVENMNHDTPAVENMNDNTSAKEIMNDVTPTVENMNDDTPTVENMNDVTPAVENMNVDTPAVENMNDDTPTVESMNDNTPAKENINDDTSTVEKMNDVTPAVENMNDDTPDEENMNDNTPTVENVNVDSPAGENMNDDTPAVGNINDEAIEKIRKKGIMIKLIKGTNSLVERNNENAAAIEKIRKSGVTVEIKGDAVPVKGNNQNSVAIKKTKENEEIIERIKKSPLTKYNPVPLLVLDSDEETEVSDNINSRKSSSTDGTSEKNHLKEPKTEKDAPIISIDSDDEVEIFQTRQSPKKLKLANKMQHYGSSPNFFPYRDLGLIFTCDFCSFSTLKKELLVKHSETHRRFQRKRKEKSIWLKSNQRCFSTIELTDKSKPLPFSLYPCHLCEFSTISRVGLLSHLNSHSDDHT